MHPPCDYYYNASIIGEAAPKGNKGRRIYYGCKTPPTTRVSPMIEPSESPYQKNSPAKNAGLMDGDDPCRSRW